MDVSTWKEIWHVIFYVASLMFYGTVTVVAVKGAGDVVSMIGKMIEGRRRSS
ncbi:MAG: hypothetical protein HN712_10905 [Gemmatimonadetes bacterium]|jgi:hypothetical protein|nr:hypothetical protein [Gemmatimonadota bacterium]MBT7860814.1 hypothetical protein [Gemmatimonadota bacterium]